MKNREERKYWVWLSFMKGLGSKRILELLKHYPNPKEIYKLSKKELLKIKGIGEQLANTILEEETRMLAEKQNLYMEKNKIQLLTIEDEEYPEPLKQMYDAPVSLYVKGDISILNQFGIAIIGSRQCSDYGKIMTKKFAYGLAKEDVIIISGLAKGIDSYAHLGCLEANKKTIAVLGCGLDIIYPKENLFLYQEIIRKGGCILTEYPLGTPANRMNFPARNRIISGISQGVLVVEAKEKSGTLITVDFALEQGKEVYVVPR